MMINSLILTFVTLNRLQHYRLLEISQI